MCMADMPVDTVSIFDSPDFPSDMSPSAQQVTGLRGADEPATTHHSSER